MGFDRDGPGQGRVDAFGDEIVKGTQNELDLPAFHSFSEERYRYFENGTRIQDPDADSTRFADQDKSFLLEPQAGDTLQLLTAERPRYIVGNDTALSWSFQFGTDLQDATDRMSLLLEGAFRLDYFGDGTLELVTVLDGADDETRTKDLPTSRTNPTRPELRFNWYAVGRIEATISYTTDDDQRVTDEVVLTNDDDWLSDNPTQRMGWELDVTNPGIQLEAGSLAYIPQTDSPPTARNKPMAFSSGELNDIPATGYGVLGALRIDPDRDDVFTTITSVDANAEQSVDIEVFFKAVPPSSTDADFEDPDDDGDVEGAEYPRWTSPQNNVLQWTPNVSTFPARTYGVDGSTIPAGRLIGGTTQGSAGTAPNTTRTGITRAANRPVYPDDVVLMLGHTPDQNQTTAVDLFVGSDQDW